MQVQYGNPNIFEHIIVAEYAVMHYPVLEAVIGSLQRENVFSCNGRCGGAGSLGVTQLP